MRWLFSGDQRWTIHLKYSSLFFKGQTKPFFILQLCHSWGTCWLCGPVAPELAGSGDQPQNLKGFPWAGAWAGWAEGGIFWPSRASGVKGEPSGGVQSPVPTFNRSLVLCGGQRSCTSGRSDALELAPCKPRFP